MSALDQAFDYRYSTCETLTSHNSLTAFGALPSCRSKPLIYDIDLIFTGYPSGSNPNVLGATEIYISITAISDLSISNYPFYLNKGQILTCSNPVLSIAITEDAKFTALNTPQLVQCKPLENTISNATGILSMYSIAFLKGSTNISSSFSDTLQETTSLEQSTYSKQQIMSTDLSVSVDFITKREDPAYHDIITRARRYFESVWVLITQSSPDEPGFWVYGSANITNPSQSASLKDVLRGNFSLTWTDGASKWGNSVNFLTADELAAYNQAFSLAGVGSQTTSASNLPQVSVTSNTATINSRQITLNVDYSQPISSVVWTATPAIGTFNNNTLVSPTYTITQPIGKSTPIVFTAVVNGNTTLTDSAVEVIYEFRDLVTVVYNSSSAQWIDTATFLTNPTNSDEITIYIAKPSGTLNLNIVATDFDSATDTIKMFDGDYGLANNSNLVASINTSWSGGSYSFPSGKATILFVSVNNVGLASKLNFTMS